MSPETVNIVRHPKYSRIRDEDLKNLKLLFKMDWGELYITIRKNCSN